MMQTDEKALKPCPFCGGKARMIGGPFSQECYSVWCAATGCNTRVMGTMSAEATVEKWNRRSFSTVTPTEVGGLVERLREGTHGSDITKTDSYLNGIMREAASALQAQSAELAAAKAENAELRHDIASYVEAASNLATELFDTEAALAHREAEAVYVKPLEWKSEDPYSVARVPLLSLMYSTECVWIDGKFAHCELRGNVRPQEFDTVEAAKAAAQADYERRILSALTTEPAAPQEAEAVAWVARIAEVLDDGDGFWRSCSGCHELNEGVPTGAYSAAFRAHAGLGCRECGGLGVVWDDTDYAAMGDYLAASAPQAVTEAQVAKQEAIDMLIKADDVWTDYGSGFRVHFSFSANSGLMGVVERINTARALTAAQESSR